MIIPANCTLDVDSCSLVVSGDITNSGTLRASTGTITVSGNWLSSGVFTSGTGTVTFNKSAGVQTLNTGGLANAFYNISHTGAGTVQLDTNLIDINNSFSNTAGTFDANSINMTVAKNWTNTGTFTPGTGTVTLDGSNQTITGSTTFYNLTKITAVTDTLTFSANGTDETSVSHFITLRGAAANLLSLEKSGANAQAKINLGASGGQSLQYLDVQNHNATGRTLHAGLTSNNDGNTTNWTFGNQSFNWDGTVSTDWDDPFNWSGGIVPAPGDSVTIQPIGGTVAFQPTLSTNVVVGNLTLQAGSILTLGGKNLTVSTTFTSSGTLVLRGSETVNLTQDTVNPGTFRYVGTNTGANITVKDFGATDYYNLVINDTNVTPDTFVTNGNLTMAGSLTVTASVLNTSTNSNTVTIANDLTINGGTLTATNSTIAVTDDVTISSGTLTAPSSTLNTGFTVGGDWAFSGGTYTNSSGKVTLTGTNQTISGSSTFYQLRKVVAAADTLTFTAGTTQTVSNNITLSGASGQLLSLRSSATPAQANLTLSAGGTQNIGYVNVMDNNASGGVLLVARNSSVNAGNNTNWSFAGVNLTWDGSASTDWDTAANWDLGVVPYVGDSVTIANVGNQPATLATNVQIDDLTINVGATVLANGKNLVIDDVFTNNGTLTLFGSETVTIATMDINSGVVKYVGDGDGVQDTFTVKDFGATDYYDLQIADVNATTDIFRTNSNFTVAGDVSVSGGTLDFATNSNTLSVADDFSVTGGTFIAPPGTTNTSFTVAGDFARTGGTYTNSSGKLTLTGTSQTMSGSTTFYQLRKVVAAADTLTFTAGTTQTVTNNITMQGASGQLLSLRSSATPAQANLTLQAGGSQSIQFVDVKDNNASGGLLLVAQNASVNSGNNNNWSFGSAVLTWTGGTSTDWDLPANWDLGLAPTSVDSVIIPNVATQPTLSTAATVVDLTINAGAILTLSGNNLTVTDDLSNDGTVTLRGSETVKIADIDTDSGTFNYVGTGAASTFNIRILDPTTSNVLTNEYYNLTINDPTNLGTFQRSANVNVLGALTVTNGNLDLSTYTATVTGNIAVNGGTLTATNGNIDANGSVTVAGTGALLAPGSGKSFTIADDFIHTAGTFTHNNGRVTFDSAAIASITGDTTFYDLISSTAGKQFIFAAGSTQTVANSFSFTGTTASPIVLGSSIPTTDWNIDVTGGNQVVGQLTVQDSNALTNTITCLNCTNNGNNNANWLFTTLSFTAPLDNRTVGQTPTIIGVGPASTNIHIKGKDTNGNEVIVATTRSDTNGNFRVVLGNDDDTSGTTSVTSGVQLKISTVAFDNYLIPYVYNLALVEVSGTQSDVTVVASPTTLQVPTITSPANNARVQGSTPTVVGQGQATLPFTIVGKDSSGNLLLSTVGSGNVDGAGAYSTVLSTALGKGTNYLSTVVDGVSSDLLTIHLTDPYGVVFDSTGNNLIQNAQVSIYRASDNQLAQISSCDSNGNITTLRDLACTDTNPYTTGADGFYSFLTSNANYYIRVTADGYDYPSVVSALPAGRTIVTGSKGEQFTVSGVVIEMDHPVDGNAFLLRLEKNSNKTEVHVGDVVTYTITIQNISQGNAVTNNVYLADRIPPGFKYLKNRVLLDDQPMAEPSGERPLVFDIGTMASGQTKTLKYQLVVGSGVIPGTYENSVKARYASGMIISNTATKSVKVVLDPLFDMGSVIGKVFWDLNENGIQDAPEYDPTEGTTIIEKPVANVQIMMEDGTVITTDRDGKFHVPNATPGRHVLRIDERTLPMGSYVTTNKAMIIDVAQGGMIKANFGINTDNTQGMGRDAEFFNEKIALTQDRNRPALRLNAAMFTQGDFIDNFTKLNGEKLEQKPDVEQIIMYEDTLVKPVEFRLFTNYSPFIDRWQLDIFDKDTKKLVKHFEGTKFNFHDPIFWDGRSDTQQLISSERKYVYRLTVSDDKFHNDVTLEKPLDIQVIEKKEDFEALTNRFEDAAFIQARSDMYRTWVKSQSAVNNTDRQTMPIDGETISINRQGQNIKTIRLLKEGNVFVEVPVEQNIGLTPKDIMGRGLDTEEQPDLIEVVVPKGEYTLEVISGKDNGLPKPGMNGLPPMPSVSPLKSPGGLPGSGVREVVPQAGLERYARPLKVGDDYFMFVGLGDAQVGYTFNRGDVEPVQSSDKFNGGFYKEGKAAYYLKGKIKGKYLVTSSFDMNRDQKALFRQLDPNAEYPIYGDQSSVNYDATNTQGPLYLLVEWDKSKAIWGNYAVDFSDSEFATFSRSLYGGMLDYQSVASNTYGDPRTKLVVFHAEVQQRPAHNEFLGTGGSMYFLKHKDIIQGSDKIRLEVRDKITGLVISSKEMKNGADYEIDEPEGRILFWQPVSMIAKAESIVSSHLLDGNPVYVVADYQYEVKDKLRENSEGVRIAQGVGDNVIVGGTLVNETQDSKDYSLRGADVTARLGPDANIKAEIAQSSSTGASSYVSTDGGISFSEMNNGNVETGLAYGIKQDARLFNRLGLTSYYKWIENTFSSVQNTSQQGKEMAGFEMTFDLTPVTRLTARQDIQRLINNGNLQTQAQVGAQETIVTMVQVIHEQEKLKLQGAYEIREVKERIGDIVTSSNQEAKTLAGRADYALNGRVTLVAGQQFDVTDPNKNITTVGADVKVTDSLTARVRESFSPEGTATTAGLTQNVNNNIALSTDYTIAKNKDGAVVDKTASLSAQQKINENLATTATVGVVDSSTGQKTATGSLVTKAKLTDQTTVEAIVGKTAVAGGQTITTASIGGETQIGDKDGSIKTSMGVNQDAAGLTTKTMTLDATRKVDDKTQMTSQVKVDETAQGGKTSTISLTQSSKISDQLQALNEQSFKFTPDGATANDNKYTLVREKDGRKLEGTYTRSLAENPGQVTQSNIYGLTGDVNDKLALQGSIEKGTVQNLDGTRTDRTAYALGSGFVLKDTETNLERLKNSTKIELRLDDGVENSRQFVFYNAVEARFDENLSMLAKLDYSRTWNTTTGQTQQRHKEIILGAAYRPVNFDNLNFIGRYTYKENQSPSGQSSAAVTDVERNKMQVVAAEAIYDINENWQLAEKFAYRINDEKVAGFEFNRTHTWLMIHRLNYRIDRNWTLGGEYRKLTQVEAQDSKQGMLLEATRKINDNVQLGLGWNFTEFNDDLTNLSYASQGPFLRMTGAIYDRSPQEKERARAKWLDERVNDWAWVLVNKELSKSKSKVVEELNFMFAMAKDAQKAKKYNQAQQIYKDIVVAGQMMFDEASMYIRRQIAYEEKLQQYHKTAQEYYNTGDYLKARKLWEKVVDDAQKRVVQ